MVTEDGGRALLEDSDIDLDSVALATDLDFNLGVSIIVVFLRAGSEKRTCGQGGRFFGG